VQGLDESDGTYQNFGKVYQSADVRTLSGCGDICCSMKTNSITTIHLQMLTNINQKKNPVEVQLAR
jgi:hypothetical protein